MAGCYDTPKWIWRCHTTLDYLSRPFNYWPQPNQLAGSSGSQLHYENYTISPEQTVYFNKFKYRYEIYNPCNYDINLIVYDIVCKQDTTNSGQSAYWNNIEKYGTSNDAPNTTTTSDRNPIRLIEIGISNQLDFKWTQEVIMV